MTLPTPTFEISLLITTSNDDEKNKITLRDSVRGFWYGTLVGESCTKKILNATLTCQQVQSPVFINFLKTCPDPRILSRAFLILTRLTFSLKTASKHAYSFSFFTKATGAMILLQH